MAPDPDIFGGCPRSKKNMFLCGHQVQPRGDLRLALGVLRSISACTSGDSWKGGPESHEKYKMAFVLGVFFLRVVSRVPFPCFREPKTDSKVVRSGQPKKNPWIQLDLILLSNVGSTLKVHRLESKNINRKPAGSANHCPDLPASAALWKPQRCAGHPRFPGSGPDKAIALSGS